VEARASVLPAIGQPRRYKVLSRYIAYQARRWARCRSPASLRSKAPVEPLVPGAIKVRTPKLVAAGSHRSRRGVALAIELEGPETVAAVFLEPVAELGRVLPPPPGYFQRVREICDEYGVLLVSDEVICAFGRLGHWFGASATTISPTSSRWRRA